MKENLCLMTISELELRIHRIVNWILWEFKKFKRRDRLKVKVGQTEIKNIKVNQFKK